MAIFDQAGRFLVKLEPDGFLHWMVPGPWGVLRFRRWLDTQTVPYPPEPDRRCDTVAELGSIGGTEPPWLLVLEVQTRPDPDIAERLLEYVARLRCEVRHGPHGHDKYLVAAGVLNLTGTASTDRLEMLLPNTAGIGLDWHMVSKSLAAESAAGTLDAIAAGQQSLCLVPWVPLMIGGDQPEVLARWKELAAVEPSARRRGQFGGLALIFANLAQRLPQWKDALEGWNVEECEIVLEWQEQGRQRGLQQGLQQGRQEGMQQGRQEGMQQGLQDALQMVLEQRFTAPLPADIMTRVQGATDVAELRRWLNLASTVASLDELRSALGSERPV